MNLQIAKWGNSLALRIPADYVRRIGIKEGDSVEASLTADGGLSIRPVKWDTHASPTASRPGRGWPPR